jgi:uncharacterized protein YjbI with pentapeptide repeats
MLHMSRRSTRAGLILMALLSSIGVSSQMLFGPRATLRALTSQAFSTWDAVPNFIATDRRDLLALYKQQLGPLQRYRILTETGTYSRGRITYKLQAQFTQGPATIQVDLDRGHNLAEDWKIRHFMVESAALSPCLSQIDWQRCPLDQATRNTARVMAQRLAKIKQQRQCVNCDLSYANLSGQDLAGVNLTGANLTGTNLSGADLKNATLSGTNLTRTQFQSANLHSANLRDAIGTGPQFHLANLRRADLSQTDLPQANFRQANLQAAQIDRGNLEAANFYQADLQQAHLNQTSLFRANFQQAKMSHTQLNGANLQCASFGQAQARSVQIGGALLDGTILPDQVVNLPTTHARRKDVLLRC